MGRFLIVTLPATGHISPILPLATKLIMRGNEVGWYTSANFQTRIEATGARFLPYRVARDFSADKLNELFPERAKLKGLAQTKWDLKLIVDAGAEQFQDLTNILNEHPVDVVIGDALALSANFVSRKLSIPLAILNITNLFISSQDTAPDGLGLTPNTTVLGHLRNRFLNWLVLRILFRDVNAHLAEKCAQLGVPYRSKSMFEAAIDQPWLFLQPTVPAFEYPRSDLPDRVHFIGALLPNDLDEFIPPVWWNELNSDRKVVLVTQGTLANDLRALLRPAIQGLANEEYLVIATTGNQPIETLNLEPLPANVHIEQFIPYDRLMPFVDLMVTNGGYGGTHFALTHGVPLVAGGQTEDKTEVCARIAWSGVGINLKTDSPTAEQVRLSARTVLSDPRFKTRAKAMQEEFARYDAPTIAAQLLEDLIGDRTKTIETGNIPDS